MKVGLLWFDNDSRRAIEDKVQRAAAHYQRKYGHAPTVCFVHPSMLNGNDQHGELRADGVAIRPGRTVLPDHFWLGVADEQEAGHKPAAPRLQTATARASG
mgnify:CR=1 FL=1